MEKERERERHAAPKIVNCNRLSKCFAESMTRSYLENMTKEFSDIIWL